MMRNCFSLVPPGIRRGAFFLREYLFPFGCSVCGVGLVDAVESWYGLCGDCRAGMELELDESLAGRTCDRCGRPLVSEHECCLSCGADNRDGHEKPALDKAVVLFPYMGKYRQLLSAYKFGRNLALGNFFAEKAIPQLHLLNMRHDAFSEICVVPVPPRPGRMRKTGWDQVEYLVRLLERRNGKTGSGQGWPVSRCLRRLPSESQKELGRERRRANLRGRIVPVRPGPETAVVVDDVMTTGSTLESCAAALKESGTRTVFGLSLFWD
ncbi:MAG: ComF family protein [Treponema sp.]|nr:ComF family protein [Treponema sp.]